MALTKEIEIQTTVLTDGRLEVRTDTIIIEDEKELSRSYHRHVIDVGEDVTGESQIVKDIAGGVHTPDRIAARGLIKAAEAANNPHIPN